MIGLPRRITAPPCWLRLPRRTARLRLTMLYGSLFTLCGAGLLGFTFWLFYRATAGDRLVPLPGTAHAQIVMPPGRDSLPPAACRHVHPNLLAQCVEGLAVRRQHAFDLHALLVQSSIALAVMAALAFALGWLVAGRVLRPLRAITATARAISATSLHERLALAGPDDEFKELGDTLDGLFARLESSFNAVRHNVPGGTVEVSTAQRDGQAVLSVANGGPDIPPGEIGRLLQPFQRLATARISDGDGHGLGLAIVRAIATAHGGTLTARARPGGGMHVQVRIPASGAASTQRELRTTEAGTPRPTARAGDAMGL
jgi:HAMP domain-containing protein